MILSLDYSRIVAALEDRIQFLVKKFPAVSEESIRFLSGCDPTGGKYLEYLVSQRAKGAFVNRDDETACWALKHALEFYMMVNQSKNIKKNLQEIFPGLSDVPTDISGINLKHLYGLAVEYYEDVKGIIKRSKKGKHGKVVYQDDTYKIVGFAWDPSMSFEDMVSEVCTYGKGKWCTQNRSQAEGYLLRGRGLWIVFKDGKSLLQTDGEEFKDVENNNFNFQNSPDLAILLIKTGIIKLRKKTPSNPNPNRELLDTLHYYMDFITAPVRQYLQENDFM